MNRPIITSDGSHTLFNAKIGEHYHSTFGAITESEHIFIRAALGALSADIKKIRVLEIGLGTGLNALLAMRWAERNSKILHYTAIEAFPIEKEIVDKLNYPELLGVNLEKFVAIHEAKCEKLEISDQFYFTFQQTTLQESILPLDHFDVVFFDAFSPEVQPEMWTESCFVKIEKAMKQGGILTTYSCKGIVKRALKAAGFQIEKLPGPPGKREFLRAVKG